MHLQLSSINYALKFFSPPWGVHVHPCTLWLYAYECAWIHIRWCGRHLFTIKTIQTLF